MSHTPGKLIAERIPAIFNPKMDGFQLVAATPGGIELVPVALCTVNEADEENARRLVACWNALEDLSQDALDGGWTRAGLEAYGLQMKAQRDELLAALKALDEAYCRAGSPLTRDERTEDRKRLIAARKAIATAEGTTP